MTSPVNFDMIGISSRIHTNIYPINRRSSKQERSFAMPDPITLSVLGTVALTEGVKFLYSQASEVLKHWMERKDAAKEVAVQPAPTESVKIKLPPIFQGQLIEPQIHFDMVERVSKQLLELRGDLSNYAEGFIVVNTTDENLLQRIDVLRQLLEAVYQQRLTFKGEQRPPSGPMVTGQIDVEEVAGYAAGVRAREIKSGEVKGHLKAERVESGGQAFGVEVDKVGE
jgi:hypothetical protein